MRTAAGTTASSSLLRRDSGHSRGATPVLFADLYVIGHFQCGVSAACTQESCTHRRVNPPASDRAPLPGLATCYRHSWLNSLLEGFCRQILPVRRGGTAPKWRASQWFGVTFKAGTETKYQYREQSREGRGV